MAATSGAPFLEGEAKLVGFGEDVALAGHVRDEDILGIADERGIHVLVAAGQLLNGMDMETAFDE